MDRLLRLFRNRPQDDAQLTKAVEDLRRDLRTLVERLPARRPEDQALAGVKKDLHAISGRLKRMEQTAQHLGAEQRSIRMLRSPGISTAVTRARKRGLARTGNCGSHHAACIG